MKLWKYHSSDRILFFFLSFLLLTSCSKSIEKFDLERGEFSSTKALLEEWMGAYYEGKKIGYIHNRLDEGTIKGSPVKRVKTFARVEMSLEGNKTETELVQTAYLDEEGQLSSFEYSQNIMGHTMLVSGRRNDDKLLVNVSSGGDKRTKTFPYSSDLYTSGLLKYAFLKKPFKAGEEAEYKVFLEPLLTIESVRVKMLAMEKGFVDGKRTDILLLQESFKGITGTLRMTADGRTLEEVSPSGFKLLRESEKSAKSGLVALSIVDLLLASRVDVSRPLEDPRNIKSLSLRLKKVPADFPLIEDRLQKVSEARKNKETIDYLFHIQVHELSNKGETIPFDSADFASYLASDHIINADNPLIIKKARQIAGKEKDALKVAGKLYEWVNKNIDKKLIDTVSAVDTLNSGAGECQAHSNLYAALARSLGIPVKLISGLVYSEEFEGFMYHAWNEVYAGEWIPVDATLGGFPADGTHLKLAEGGMETQLQIMALVGKVEIDILD